MFRIIGVVVTLCALAVAASASFLSSKGTADLILSVGTYFLVTVQLLLTFAIV